jgi:cytochrome c oxidase subunit 2
MAGVGGVIWILVIVAMLVAVRRRDAARDATSRQSSPAQVRRAQRAVGAALLGTGLVLVAFLSFDFIAGRALGQHPDTALTIDVTGHQWWWEVEYESPDVSQRLVTANEIHVPVGQMIQIRLRAADVIHSFWAPNLNGKRDLIPGYSSTLWFKADTAGVFRGQCAEFCGLEHAKMAFYVVADPPERYAAWRSHEAAAHGQPADSGAIKGQRVFMSSGCPLCHAIAGTDARATIGPTLSHLKSRATIAAGTLPNTRANLANWIADPAAIKPGVRMPAFPLNSVERDALVSYLETLK